MREPARQQFFIPVSEKFVLAAVAIAVSALVGRFLLPLFQGTTGRLWVAALEQGLVLGVMSFLIYGGLVYQLAQVNRPKRLAVDRSANESESLCVSPADQVPAVTVVVPSYQEAGRVIRRSLFSAALQDSANRHVVLTIDDPEFATAASDLGLLAVVRSHTEEVVECLREPWTHVSEALQGFLDRTARGTLDLSQESHRLAQLYRETAVWFAEQGAHYPVSDHADELFVEITFGQPARRYAREAQRWADEVAGPTLLNSQYLLEGYRRLVARFQPEGSGSERKRAAGLSHEPDKALCLSSYISLKEQQWRVVDAGGALLLEPAGSANTDLAVADTNCVLRMDVNRTRLRWTTGVVRVGTLTPVRGKREQVTTQLEGDQKGSLLCWGDQASTKVERVFVRA